VAAQKANSQRAGTALHLGSPRGSGFDPLNHDWEARQTRREPHYKHLDRVREYRANDDLYPIESILESQAFNGAIWTPRRRGWPIWIRLLEPLDSPPFQHQTLWSLLPLS